jgi:hypothetical protein
VRPGPLPWGGASGLPDSLRRAFRHDGGSARDSLAGQPEHSTPKATGWAATRTLRP